MIDDLESEGDSVRIISDLMLDLSLATSLPLSVDGRSFIQAAAAASSLGNRTKVLKRKALRKFVYTIQPLLVLLKTDVENPVTSKAAYGLRNLIYSNECMKELIQQDGLKIISRVMEILLVKKNAELKQFGDIRSVIENLAICYREISRQHPWDIVNVGCIRHCVLILKFGDVTLQTVAVMTLANLSINLEICKQLFSYGAIKPILNVTSGSETNEACILAGLGCMIQLSKIPEIGIRLFQQGAQEVLEKNLHKSTGHSNLSIREKSLHALELFTKIPDLKSSICSVKVLKGIVKELKHGSLSSKSAVLHILLNVHNKYPEENSVLMNVKDTILQLLASHAPWDCRTLCIKAIIVLYTSDEDRLYFVERKLIDYLLEVISLKSSDLQEVPMVAFLYLMVNPSIPPILLKHGIHKVAAKSLYTDEPIIRELSILLLKALLLYDSEAIHTVVPEDKKYVLKKDPYNPQLYGAEYGGLIQEYLQNIVEQRRDHEYLIMTVPEDLITNLNITQEELSSFQNTFMELDVDCKGSLDLDELKILMVLMGEKLDIDELQEVLEEYDTDKSGALEFVEFVIMMKGWKTRYGTGLTKVINETFYRGPIGRARREFGQWWNKDKIEAAQVTLSKLEREETQANNFELLLKYFPHEKLKWKREQEVLRREADKDWYKWSTENNVDMLQGGKSLLTISYVLEGSSQILGSDASIILPPIHRNNNKMFNF